MTRRSAGILPFRWRGETIQVLLVHPGGPFWQNRDDGAWSIAKGEFGDGEPAEAAALREFTEETGWTITDTMKPLGDVRQAGGKYVTAFAVEADFDPQSFSSNTFEIEWPPRSGSRRAFPEVDRAEWFEPHEARKKLIAGQQVFIDRLLNQL